MSSEEIKLGESTIYDEEGRTVIPKPTRNSLELEKGDGVVFLYKDDKVVVQKRYD